MKVVYLNPSGQLGGAETSLLTLVEALREHDPGFLPLVVTTEEGPLGNRCARLGIPYRVIPMSGRLEGLGDAPVGVGSRSSDLRRLGLLVSCIGDFSKYAREIATLIRVEEPDIVHTNGFKMHILGAWVRGRREAGRRPALIGHIHDYISPRPLSGKLLRLLSRRFGAFIANSQSVAQDVRTCLGSRRVSAVYNSVDLKQFSPEGTSVDLDLLCGIPPTVGEVLRVGLVGTFARWKGHLTFLRALASLQTARPVKGYIIGGPIYRTVGSQFILAELESEVVRLGLAGRVGFTGFVEDVASAMRGVDVVVHASTKPEPFGMTIIEAMACGRAVVVSNLGGASELFEEGVTALGHSPGNENELAAIIGRLAANRDLCRYLGRNARENVSKRFTPAEMARHVWSVYRQVIRPLVRRVPT